MISTKLKQSKNRIFLLEITINLLLFSALLIVGLLFFIKTHKLTEETQVLHEAVNACSNAASAYEQEHGDLNAVSSLFDGSICADEKLFIYLDKSYHPCDKDDAAYKVIVSRLGQDAYGVQKADIEFIAADSHCVYSITACSYTAPHEKKKRVFKFRFFHHPAYLFHDMHCHVLGTRLCHSKL